MTYRAVDVMGFAGAFTLGTVQSGFELVGKRELPKGFGVANCEANRHLLGNSWITEITAGDKWSVPEGGADLVFGNPPCSGFSVMSAKGFRGADSKINECMWAFSNYVARVKPKIAIFESVQQAFTGETGRRLMIALRNNVEAKTGLKFTLYHVLHNARLVGGCAERRRYFWVISQIPFGVERMNDLMDVTLRDAIDDLKDLPLTWQKQSYKTPESSWATELINPAGTVDGHMTLDTPISQRIKSLLSGVPWNAGEHIAIVAKRYYETYGNLPDNWSATQDKVVDSGFKMGFTTPTRWKGDQPARVITGGAMHMVVHPDLDRLITHRECARVIGFPDTWVIEPLRGLVGLQSTWGKGISVHCGRWISRWAKAAMDEVPGQDTGTLIGDREYVIDHTKETPSKRVHNHLNIDLPVGI